MSVIENRRACNLTHIRQKLKDLLRIKVVLAEETSVDENLGFDSVMPICTSVDIMRRNKGIVKDLARITAALVMVMRLNP